MIAFLAAWFYITMDDWKYGGIPHIVKGLGSTIGVIGYFFFSFSLFLSSPSQNRIIGFLFFIVSPMVLCSKMDIAPTG